jgi:hypothetical protein
MLSNVAPAWPTLGPLRSIASRTATVAWLTLHSHLLKHSPLQDEVVTESQ